MIFLMVDECPFHGRASSPCCPVRWNVEPRARRTKQVPTVSLREDMLLRGWAPEEPRSERARRETVPLYIADHPTLTTFESRCVAAGLGKDDVTTFRARAEPFLAGHVPENKVSFCRCFHFGFRRFPRRGNFYFLGAE